jgi:hypothetical protein
MTNQEHTRLLSYMDPARVQGLSLFRRGGNTVAVIPAVAAARGIPRLRPLPRQINSRGPGELFISPSSPRTMKILEAELYSMNARSVILSRPIEDPSPRRRDGGGLLTRG